MTEHWQTLKPPTDYEMELTGCDGRCQACDRRRALRYSPDMERCVCVVCHAEAMADESFA